MGWVSAAVLAAAAATQNSPGLRSDLPGDAVVWVALTVVVGAVAWVVLRRRPALAGLAAIPAAAAWAVALFNAPGQRAAPELDRPHLVVVTLDTFRADHLALVAPPPWGQPIPTPHLDALASEGACFTQAVTTAPLTAPAHASMWTGLPTPDHGLLANGGQLQADTVVPLLQAQGYRTGAFVSSAVLDRSTGLDQGWDHYEDRWAWQDRAAWVPGVPTLLGRGPLVRRGDLTVERALEWLDQDPGAALLWVHLYDPHTPYAPPPEFMPSAEDAAQARLSVRRSETPASVGEWSRSLEQRHAVGQRMLYAGEIRWTDALVGRLVAGLPDDAVVIVLADHGEGLGEHDAWYTHGADLYEPSLHVPLIVRAPGFDAGSTPAHLTSIQGVAGLLADLAGVDWAGPRLEPQDSVLAYTTGQQARRGPNAPAPERVAALRTDAWKVVASESKAAVAFDLRADPQEAHPLPAGPEATLDALDRALAAPTPDVDSATQERLRALGYTD